MGGDGRGVGRAQAAVVNDGSVGYEVHALNPYASVLPSAGAPAYDADGHPLFGMAQKMETSRKGEWGHEVLAKIK